MFVVEKDLEMIDIKLTESVQCKRAGTWFGLLHTDLLLCWSFSLTGALHFQLYIVDCTSKQKDIN